MAASSARVKIAARRPGERLLRRPMGVAALVICAVEALAALAGAPSPILSALLLAAPGLALVPLLPARMRQERIAALAGALPLGLAASSVALITMSSVGISLTGWSTRAAVAVLVLVGLAAFRDGEPAERTPRVAWLALGGLTLAGVALQARVIGTDPVPGNDWAKYVLYGQEIHRHGALLIDNPFWMLGVPFREDPGVPALFGSWLGLSEEPAAALMHGIWAFAVVLPLSVFAFARAAFGMTAGLVAAALAAVIPISQDILGWHGLANLAALATIPLALGYLDALLRDEPSWRQAAGFGVVLVALAGYHRLSFLVTLAVLGVVVCAGLLGRDRRRFVRGLLMGLGAALLVCPGVVYDLAERGSTFGGTLGYRSYDSSRVNLGPIVKDLSPGFAVAGALAAIACLWWGVRRRDRSVVAPLGLLAVTVVLAYSWVIHLPLVYFRMAYFLPVALAPLVAYALLRLLPTRWGAIAGVALALVGAAMAWPQAENVRRFYDFSTPAALRGLDHVAASIRPGEVVVTDRCWSFLSTWYLQTRILPALEPEDIQPRAEALRAVEARAILAGGPSGQGFRDRYGARFAVVDPACADARGFPARPPKAGRPVYVSDRLVVLDLR